MLFLWSVIRQHPVPAAAVRRTNASESKGIDFIHCATIPRVLFAESPTQAEKYRGSTSSPQLSAIMFHGISLFNIRKFQCKTTFFVIFRRIKEFLQLRAIKSPKLTVFTGKNLLLLMDKSSSVSSIFNIFKITVKD